jgi:acyl-CoA synthetase (AMP-forming)/AMP-acid ligase II
MPAPLHPTSGTTGTPKLAVRPLASALAEARHYVESFSLGLSDSLLIVTPMSHAYAFGLGVMTPLLSSCRIATLRRFNPRLARRALSQADVTLFPAAPIMLELICSDVGNGDLGYRGRVLSSGAPLPTALAERYRDRFGIDLLSSYGTTETGVISIALDGVREPGCVGRPVPEVELKLVPLEDSTDTSVGRLWVRSTSMMAGYVGERRLERTDPDAWWDTGDLVRRDADGSIILLGRSTEVINVFGLKVIPSEVEAIIAALPAVSEVKVYPGLHRSGGQLVAAAVVCCSPMSELALREHCLAHLAAYKCPQRFHFMPALPRTASGKIILAQLPQ